MNTYNLKLHKTYYNKGFFNVPVDYDRYVQLIEGDLTIMLGHEIIPGRSTRKANRNGTARIFGNARLRDWLQANFDMHEVVSIDFLDPNKIRIHT